MISAQARVHDLIKEIGRRRPLTGEVILVTGAGRGIGRESAVAMSRLGAAIVVVELSEAGERTATAIQEAGGSALCVRADVSDEAAMKRVHDQALARYGHVDVVVNNACVFYAKPVLEHSLAEWDRVMAVNLRGAFLAARLFLPDMLARHHGVFVTMESGEGMPYIAPYLASKVGLRSLAASLSQEVGPDSGVSIFCFGPGMVDTPAIREALPDLARLYGMSEDDFIRQSAPGGSLSSATEAAAGLAGCILNAARFHGQETATPTGLSLLDGSTPTPAAEGRGPQAVGGTPPTTSDPIRMAAQLIADLHRECEELGLFQRQWYRRTLKQSTGLSLEDWESASRSNAWRADKLRLLGAHFEKLEREARGYFRNPEQLEQAIAALEVRRITAEAAAAALEA